MNQRLLQEVLASTKLPTPPAIALQIIEMTDDPSVTPADLTNLIQSDGALSAKILKTVNSAFYGLTTPASTIQRAQIMLGLNAIKTLTLGFSLVQALDNGDDDGFDYTGYWRRSIHAAACAKVIASRTKVMEPEEALLGGLLQDMGMVVLHRTLGRDYAGILAGASTDHRELAKLEMDKLELTHAIVGATLAERWRFPASLISPIRYHEQPTAAPKSQQLPVRCVGLASLAASALTQQNPAPVISQYVRCIKEWFGLEQPEAESILEEAATGASAFAKLLEIDAGSPALCHEILEEARDKLLDQASTPMVDETVDVLKKKQMNDALTGIASRRGCLSMLQEAFVTAHEGDGLLTVATLDVDAFRSINDEHGREVGDAVLIEIAQRLESSFKSLGGSVARTGGETFSVLLPGVDGRAAAQLSANLIEEFAHNPLNPLGEGVEPSLTLSIRIGITTMTHENGEAFSAPLALLTASEKALEAARGAGGQAVRAFIPQVRRAA